LIFNFMAEVKLPPDKWTMIDIICAFLNIICFNLIGSVSPEQILNSSQKRTLDYYVILVVIFSWIRFFSYFLVVKSISRLMMTLIQMILAAMSFLFIFTCFMVISASMFTTLFQETSVQYSTIILSLRTLLDSTFGNYSQAGMGKYQTAHSILLMTHVFISTIFLLNYLIAILSTVYNQMLEKGDFSYKSNKYQYIERYSIAMLD